MSRSWFYVVCCLVIVHSSLALPIILPRDGVMEAKPQSLRPRCLLLCADPDEYDFYYNSSWSEDPPPPPQPDSASWDHSWGEHFDGPPPYCDGLCLELKSTEGPDGGPPGTQIHSVTKSVPQEHSVAGGGSGGEESAVAQSGNEKSLVSQNGNRESSVPENNTTESSVVEIS
ncbi:hypothetical protein PCANC_03622 [Puccinia coronata f. sp. avenae]|uniref:Uncharacterized protein n=1 Tax=Puccinia coronata f. sp. avenae TaxID=200324 RepID=A0A2N5VUX8_9BASI|nr:hypothetical protein PCASD_10455 [Puccinia coronata f. sp. avenae]PLW53766.1 hypothetical protein PCANC_03622 [Puccinia coronata f. sp. avenae]